MLKMWQGCVQAKKNCQVVLKCTLSEEQLSLGHHHHHHVYNSEWALLLCFISCTSWLSPSLSYGFTMAAWPLAIKEAALFSLSDYLFSRDTCPSLSPNASLWGKCQLIKGNMVDLSHPHLEVCQSTQEPGFMLQVEHATEAHIRTHKHTQNTGQLGLWYAKYCWVPTG